MENIIGVIGDKYIFRGFEVDDITIILGKSKTLGTNNLIIAPANQDMRRYKIKYNFIGYTEFKLSDIYGKKSDKANLVNYIHTSIIDYNKEIIKVSEMPITPETLASVILFNDDRLDYVYGLILSEYEGALK